MTTTILLEWTFWLATAVFICGGVWFLTIAFRESIWWGLGSLFIPFLAIAYAVLDWPNAGKPFLITASALVIVIWLNVDTIVGLLEPQPEFASRISHVDRPTPKKTPQTQVDTANEQPRADVEVAAEVVVPVRPTTTPRQAPPPEPEAEVEMEMEESAIVARSESELIPAPKIVRVGASLDRDPFEKFRKLSPEQLPAHAEQFIGAEIVVCTRRGKARVGHLISVDRGKLVLEKRLAKGVFKTQVARREATSIILPNQHGQLEMDHRYYDSNACR